MGVLDVKRLAALVLSLAVLAAGCSKPGVSTNPSAGGRVNSFTVPHVLRYATGEDFSSLNPMLSQQTTLGLMASLTMAWLVRWDVHNHAYPELATAIPTMANGGVSKDGLTITYHLRKGVKWSDGVPFTADDVVWSTSAVLNPANNITSRTGWDLIKNVGEPDKYTVVFHMKKPYSPFIQSFFSTEGANPCILPKHLLAQYPNINNVAYNSLPVGIGPFKYKVWKRGQEVVMVPDPLYWRGPPKLHEVDFMIVPDANTLLTQVEAKEIDLWYNAPQNRYKQLKQLAPYTVYVENSYYFRHLDFNTSTAHLSDPAVRQA
ncbi:MAG: ABC transporter substrate-binding protein, partial [Candidatus Eremiobacteraeota bacterium]|nr:ABC transporter substrate-binding protein [Candidatus Eremiobacteraeota bacterium]